MKRLSFEQEGREIPGTMERLRQGFLNRMKDAAIVGAVVFSLGGCAGGMASMPSGSLPGAGRNSVTTPSGRPVISPNLLLAASKEAVGSTATTVEIGGRTLNIVRLDTQLAELDRQTVRYREPEELPVEMGGTGPLATRDGRYANSVLVPNEARFIVTLNSRDGTRRVDIVFPRERDSDPTAVGAGIRTVNLNEFATYVRTLTGQEMARVNFIVETGTFNNNGVTTNFTNAYIFPLNASGHVITRRGNGEYIIYSASYYASSAGGTASLLVEPNGRDSLYASR